MSLCPHGYTANWDCPICECCCGSGLSAGECRCIGRVMPKTPAGLDDDAALIAGDHHPVGCICETCSAAFEREKWDPRDRGAL